MKVQPEKKLLSNNRREYRRQVAAQKKAQKRSEIIRQSPSPCSAVLSEELSTISIPGKTQKKVVQMIRNRISAQNSRDRRKVYVQSLEQTRDMLNDENVKLSDDKAKLIEQVKRLGKANAKLLKENQSLKKENKNILCKDCQGSMDKLHQCGAEAKLAEYLSEQGDLVAPDFKNLSQVPKSLLKFSFSLGIVLSLIMLIQLNQQRDPSVNSKQISISI